MTPFLCDIAIDFDAQSAYQASYIEKLINQIQTALTEAEDTNVVVVLKNAHYLTMKAFSVLYDYIRELHFNVILILVFSDKSRIFPPLLEYVQANA